MSTQAEAFADLLDNDGQKWTTSDGREFSEAIKEAGASPEWGRCHRADDDGEDQWEEVYRGDIHDAVRYVFPDGSAIVEAGGAWDIEKPGHPFVMDGA